MSARKKSVAARRRLNAQATFAKDLLDDSERIDRATLAIMSALEQHAIAKDLAEHLTTIASASASVRFKGHLDTESMLVGLRNARHEAIMAWSPDPESEAAVHLLNALLDVELAIVALERDNDSGRRASVPRTADDEPSAGYVVEEPEDVVKLARSMQQKRHGGST